MSNDKKVYYYTATIVSIWFSGFILGSERRMGVERSQDEALTADQLLLIGEIAKEDLSKSNYEEEKKKLESTIAFSKIAFCVYLRGEEVPLIVIEGLNMFWK